MGPARGFKEGRAPWPSAQLLLEDELGIITISDNIKKKRLRVVSMSETRPTLEDVYISLVGRGLK